jgi:hypothetical protein
MAPDIVVSHNARKVVYCHPNPAARCAIQDFCNSEFRSKVEAF